MAKNTSFRTFICSFTDCPASYNKAWKLEAHMCKHTGVKPFKCDHNGCDKSFTSQYHLTRHTVTHSGERPFSCKIDGCTAGFTTNSNRQKHINRHHNNQDQKIYVCEFEDCGKAFKKNNQLKAHQCEQHSLILPPYKCTFEGCEKRFSFPNKLRRHEKVHKGYPCEDESCSFTGKTWSEYLKHKRETHIVLFECKECHKKFRDSWFLQQHMRVHSETRQVLVCPKKECGRSFTTLFNLQNHIRSFHEEQRPFSCSHPDCGKTFAMKQSLERHGVVHDPERKKQKTARPMRSLASRLSGYKTKKRNDRPKQKETLSAQQAIICSQTEQSNHDRPEPTLASLLQDSLPACVTRS